MILPDDNQHYDDENTPKIDTFAFNSNHIKSQKSFANLYHFDFVKSRNFFKLRNVCFDFEICCCTGVPALECSGWKRARALSVWMKTKHKFAKSQKEIKTKKFIMKPKIFVNSMITKAIRNLQTKWESEWAKRKVSSFQNYPLFRVNS